MSKAVKGVRIDLDLELAADAHMVSLEFRHNRVLRIEGNIDKVQILEIEEGILQVNSPRHLWPIEGREKLDGAFWCEECNNVVENEYKDAHEGRICMENRMQLLLNHLKRKSDELERLHAQVREMQNGAK